MARAEDFIKRAERCLDDARRSQYDEYAVSIERASECIELSLKAAILSIGEKYPTEHDTSEDLLRLICFLVENYNCTSSVYKVWI